MWLDKNEVSVVWCVHLNFPEWEQLFCTGSSEDQALKVKNCWNPTQQESLWGTGDNGQAPFL